MVQQELVRQIVPPLDQELAESLIQEFISLERRYVLCDWEPATLDGGQFSEIAARIIYHIDSGNLNHRRGVHPCLTYIEDENNSNAHGLRPHRTALHLARVLRTIYRFRSQRGAVHIDPDYTANELDTTLIMGCVRWVMSELLRVFWSGSRPDVARAIREIVRFDVPAVLSVDGRYLVLRTDCTAEEEVLILLHSAGEEGLARDQIGQGVQKSAPSITNALRALCSTRRRQVLKRANGTYALTPVGTKRIREELANKLVIS